MAGTPPAPRYRPALMHPMVGPTGHRPDGAGNN